MLLALPPGSLRLESSPLTLSLYELVFLHLSLGTCKGFASCQYMGSVSGAHAAAERIRSRAIRLQFETLAAILPPHDKCDSTEKSLQHTEKILLHTIDSLQLLRAKVDTSLTQINASSTEGKGTK